MDKIIIYRDAVRGWCFTTQKEYTTITSTQDVKVIYCEGFSDADQLREYLASLGIKKSNIKIFRG